MCSRDADVPRKALTVSRKSERLVNLTIALLATKRFISKQEIFDSVEGYEGNFESKERMFERDKDDLRSLGIEIEVGSFDPLFSDEPGYRIKQERYQLDLGPISPLEVSVLSLAAQAWKGASLEDAAQRALVKLRSLGFAIDEANVPASVPLMSQPDQRLTIVTRAIANRSIMQFGYQNFEMIEQPRSVVPLSISSRDGHWYFSGIDQDLQEMRTFRFDRVSSEFTIRKTPKDFELPDDLSQNEVLNSQQTAILDVRRGKGIALRSISVSQEHLGEWDRIKIPLYDIKSMVALILWHGEDVFVHEPVGLCEAVVESLRALVTTHG